MWCALAASVANARPVPVLQNRVTDEAGAISIADAQRLEQKLRAYEEQTGHQLAVLIVPDLDGEPIESFGMRAAEAWKLGAKNRDDGAIVLLAMADRAVRIEVGHGLEGAIPDALAGRIIRDAMTPRLRAGDTAGAIDVALDQLMRAAAGEAVGPAPPMTSEPPAMPHIIWAAFIILLVILSLSRRRGLRTIGAFGLMNAGRLGGGSFGGSFGGGGGGGGFSGGGGSFGGGGASGRW